MVRSLSRFLFGTLRGRLIVGVAAVHAVMMALFVADLTVRQRAMLLDRQAEEATALSQALATSAAGWIAADDVAGLQELVEAERRYPEMTFAVLTDGQGRVLADTDRSRLGLFLRDLPAEGRLTVLSRTPGLVDVATPAVIGGRHVGWARVGIGQRAAGEKLAQITRSGAMYAVAAIVIGSIIAWFMGSRITHRLYAIQATIDEVRCGNRLARTSIAGSDEAAVMAREFNSMLDAIAARDADVRASEEKFSRAFHSSPNLMAITTPGEGRIMEINAAYCHALGYDRDEMVGRTTSELAIWADPEQRARVVGAVAVDGHAHNIEADLRSKSGEIRTVVLSLESISVHDSDYLLSVAVDITERKRAERSLVLMNFALDNVHESAFLTDKNGHFHYVNEAASRALGYTREEMLGMTVADIDPGLPPERWGDHWNELKARRSHTLEGRHKARDGRLFPVEISTNYFEYGGRGYNLALVRDITERRKAEEKERLLGAIVESSDDAILAEDMTGVILSWNRGAERIYGYGAGEIVGRSVSLVIPPDHPDELSEIMAAIGRGERIEHYETSRLRKGGERIFVSLTISPIRDGGGAVVGLSAIARDITERKRAEEELQRLNEELEQRVKDRTAELETKNRELEHMNRLFVGRELRMVELKEKIRGLEGKR